MVDAGDDTLLEVANTVLTVWLCSCDVIFDVCGEMLLEVADIELTA